MSVVSAQVSLYPLRQASIGPTIREVVCVFGEHNLETRVGPMSTLVWGEEEAVFDALHEAFRRASEYGDTVMSVAISNACPMPEE